jgi:restriction system protein
MYGFEKRIQHAGLKAYRIIRGATQYDVETKAKLQCALWDDKWRRICEAQTKKVQKERQASRTFQQKEWALERTKQAEAEMAAMGSLLVNGIEIDLVVDWEKLKDISSFPIPYPTEPRPDVLPAQPTHKVIPEPLPPPPVPEPRLNWWQKLIPALKRRNDNLIRDRRTQAESEHQRELQEWRDAVEKERQSVFQGWREAVDKVEASNRELGKLHAAELVKWFGMSEEHVQKQMEQHAFVDEQHQEYLSKDPIALYDYWNRVLGESEYPDAFPRSFTFDFLPDAKILIVEYSLPNISALPQVKEVKYVASRGEFQEVPVSAAWLNRTYDSVLYQIALRTIYELFQSDSVDAIKSIVFNGWVNSIEKATGKEVTNCVISVQAEKAEFMAINLAQVEPRACFKKLKGVSGGKLVDLSPVRPMLQLNKDDKRFVSSYEIADVLDDSYNLAAMDWLDFENLIREVFEKEFNTGGGEVKITRASRDGGVDAVAFDPDPIRGGKIVIQAKRYTNTVSVSAVRDLYGTVLNEGATKGILVTTADYGPDAYEFAKGKPLTLLSGSELLYLLQKHGHRARIDLAEAKRLADLVGGQK